MKATAMIFNSVGERLTIDIPKDMIGHTLEVILVDKMSEKEENIIKKEEKDPFDWDPYDTEETKSFAMSSMALVTDIDEEDYSIW